MTPGRLQLGRRERQMAVVLWAALLLVLSLTVRALLAERSRYQMAGAALDGHAAFAAARIASELDFFFQGVFLDQIAAARLAHFGGALEPTAELPSGNRYLPPGGVPFHFSLDPVAGRLVWRGSRPAPELESWIVDRLLAHAREVYPAPAPYAVLREDGGGTLAAVYRKEQAPWREQPELFGFVVDFAAFGPLYHRLSRTVPLLPRGADEPSGGGPLFLRVELSPGPVLFTAPASYGPSLAAAEAYAPKAGRMRVIPAHVSQIPAFIESGAIGCDVAFVQVSPPDENGRYSLGLAADYTRIAVDKARIVIAEMNRQVPQSLCDGALTEADIDVLVETDRPLLELPSAKVTSTDLSSAVEANQENFPQSARHRVIQCDIHAMPFRPAEYDLVLCLGVIQHTPDPEATLEKLYAQVKAGGWLVLDHYRATLSHYTKIPLLLLRPILKRLSPERGIAVTERLTKMLFPLHRLVKSMQVVLSRISPLLTYFQAHPQLDDALQYQWALVDTHDALTDYYKHFRNEVQIRDALSRLGAEGVWVTRGGNGVEARCRRPTA